MMKKQTITEGTLLWEPSQKQIEQANLTMFNKWLAKEKGKHFRSYDELWQWSADEIEEFWEIIWEYFDIKAAKPYTSVLKNREMPGAEWFEGAELNFVDQVFRHRNFSFPAIITSDESLELREIGWEELHQKTAAVASALQELGVKKGDRVAAYINNIPEAVIAMLATASIGAVWSCCSPDFGADSVIDRFGQIKPKVLIAVDGYRYGGKTFDRMDRIVRLQRELPGLEYTVLLSVLYKEADLSRLHNPANTVLWDHLELNDPGDFSIEPVSFSHPLWVLYSSGTTGLPKPIVHSHGGMLLEHLKYREFHADLKEGDRFFWFSTTGWMMWNVVVASLLKDSTALLYDGSPGYPDPGVLWEFCEKTGATTFGSSAAYLINCMKQGLEPGKTYNLEKLKSMGSTGSPLPPEAFQWVYEHVGRDIWLYSTSGGTDICSSFVSGNPLLPVHAGEIQCRTLGANVQAFDEDGEPVTDEVGEMVITEPMPCMPLYFWGDEDGNRYHESYFEMYPGIWRHGDWLKMTPRGSCVIYGRSDATLNRMGVRIGTSEIYRAVDLETRVKDSLVVSLEQEDNTWYMPLFVQLEEGDEVNEELERSIAENIRERIAPRFVPDEVVRVEQIPYTLSGKKMEKPVQRILQGDPADKVASRDSMKNPEALDIFVTFAKERLKAR